MVARGYRKIAEDGFTLVELMIVMLVIAVLLGLAVPKYTSSVRQAKEAVLKEDLHVLRGAIDAYTVDKQKAPASLDELVSAGYLKALPEDPFTRRSDSWQPVVTDTLRSIDQTEPGIDDVHSGSTESSSDGQPYASW